MDSGRKFSIRITVGGLLILATLITGLVAVSLQYHFTKELTKEELVNRFSQTSQALSAGITKLDFDANFTVQLLAEVSQDRLDPRHEQRQLEILRQALDGNEMFYSAYFGYGNEHFIQLVNLQSSHLVREKLKAKASDRWAVISYHDQPKRMKTTRLFNDQFKQTASYTEAANFFPTQRPWYKGAIQSGNYKTDPYLFHNLEVNGQTYAQRVGDSDVVIGIDVVLSAIARSFSENAKRNHVANVAEAYFFDQYGEILATNQSVASSVSLPPSAPLYLSPEQLSYIDQLGSVSVSNQDAWEPMDFSVSGVPKGYAIDMFGFISEMTGIKFRFNNGQSWNQLKQGFRNGDIDVLHSIQKNSGSRDLGLFSKPMFNMPFALVTEPSEPVTDLRQWSGKRLGIIAGWSIIPVLKDNYQQLEIIEFNELKPAFNAMRQGTIDGIIGSKQVLQHKISQYYFGDAQLHDGLTGINNRFDGDFYLMVSQQQQPLLEILNLALANISAKQKQALTEKWLQAEHGRPSAKYISTVPHKAILDIIDSGKGLGELQKLDLDGRPSYLFVDQVGKLNQIKDYFAVALPESFILATVADRIRSSVLITAAIIVLLLPLAWVFSRPIVRPIMQLRNETLKIKKRQFDKVRPVATNIKEVHYLSQSVNNMATTIAAHEQAQKEFIESFIKLIANAIDDKSPYTAGHCLRVPELGLMLAEALEQTQQGPFADFAFANDDERREFRIAAWLHDCGKITTPDHIVDKGSKLEAIYNRIHEVRMRFEVLWRDAEIETLTEIAAHPEDRQRLQQQLQQRQQQLQQQFAFVANCNVGGEYFDEAKIAELEQIAAQTWVRHFDDRLGLSPQEETQLQGPGASLPVVEPLLSDKPEHKISARHDRHIDPELGINMVPPQLEQNLGELYNLCIGRGTLTDEDRYRINEHMVSGIKMLESLPFPPELKKVARYATTHHETLTGSGYPRGLTANELSIPEQVLVIADIFEALTASDRPYKRAKPLSVAIDIMDKMASNQHFDRALFELFLSSGTYLRYAKAYLKPEQIDEVDINRYLSSEDHRAA